MELFGLRLFQAVLPARNKANGPFIDAGSRTCDSAISGPERARATSPVRIPPDVQLLVR
jgi:hypothetical protein